MSAGKLKKLILNLDEQLDELIGYVTCTVCHELFCDAVTTSCGHAFCQVCLKRVLSSKSNNGCPLCKQILHRRELKTDKALSAITKICSDLSLAFKADLTSLGLLTNSPIDDFMHSSKLCQLSSDNLKDGKRKNNTKVKDDNKDKDDTFVPKLKRTQQVIQYPCPKKKNADELISVSQVEVSSDCEIQPGPLDKKLKKLEKVAPDEKINQWFDIAGENLYLNTSNNSILAEVKKKEKDAQKAEAVKSAMIRVDYNKTAKPEEKKEDPYEFIASQNSKLTVKKRKKSMTKKKIPDFCALQSFTKESVRRSNLINLDDKNEEEIELSPKKSLGSSVEVLSEEPAITASQKFEKLLSETQKKERKTHVLYSPTQGGSDQSLLCSYQSDVMFEKIAPPNPVAPKKGIMEQNFFYETPKRTEESGSDAETKPEAVSKRKRSLRRPEQKRKKFEEVKEEKKKTTRLKELLEEVINDDLIDYEIDEESESQVPKRNSSVSNISSNSRSPGWSRVSGMKADFGSPKKHTMKSLNVSGGEQTNASKIIHRVVEDEPPSKQTDLYIEDLSQTSNLISGFTQQEPRESSFKRMVEDMEAEIEDLKDKKVEEAAPKVAQKRKRKKSLAFTLKGSLKRRKNSSVVFLQFGRVTPLLKRNRPTVLRLVVPNPSEKRTTVALQTTPQKITRSVSCQTSPVMKSSELVQTSEVEKVSTGVQMTQIEALSKGVQMTQIEAISKSVQMTQIEAISKGVQMTPAQVTSIGVQMTESTKTSSGVQTTQAEGKSIEWEDCEDLVKITSQQPKDPALSFTDSQFQNEFDKSWGKNSEKDEALTQTVILPRVCSQDSDVVKPSERSRRAGRIFSQDLSSPVEKYEGRQLLPLEVERTTVDDEDVPVVDLITQKNQSQCDSQELVQRVLQNIDMDLKKSTHSEESDSDLFVEQTPPKFNKSGILECAKMTPKLAAPEENNSEGTDIIPNTVPPKNESFLVLTGTPEVKKKEFPSKQSFFEMQLDENDKNKINSHKEDKKEKSAQAKAVIEAWKRTEAGPATKRKICIVTSSVKNGDNIDKFVQRFKVDYSSRPVKHMTHLVVGLHESEDDEPMPLCTPKLLFAIANKKWVVTELWIETCLQLNMILPEESFESVDSIGGDGCKAARLSMEPLLKDCEIYLLGQFEMISKNDFADLIIDCGGTLVQPTKFSYLPNKIRMVIVDRDCLQLDENHVQEIFNKYRTVVLSRDVIIQSIQSYKLVNFSSHLITLTSEKELVSLGYPYLLVRNEEESECSTYK